ncbi:hypothetical protein C5167_023657 [Papaver somniferum]|uniref:Uncharacterized protein n=1 Tax=Papaver somniferum TaxID=3469 RepID=A0A4Y7JPF3_PAPSO|nr:hypothetical protein C5167_023657 [Papaver somniferum]
MDSSASVMSYDSFSCYFGFSCDYGCGSINPASTPATVVLLGRTSGIIYPIGVVTCTLVEEYLDFAY